MTSFLKSRAMSESLFLKSRTLSESEGGGALLQRELRAKPGPCERIFPDRSFAKAGASPLRQAQGSGFQKVTVLLVTMLASLNLMAADKPSLPLPSSGNVTLTLAEYDRLVDLAGKAAKQRELPPVPYTLKRADLRLHVASESVVGTVQLDGEVFGKGAAKVPLTGGLTIFNARQEGRMLPLLEEGSTATAVLPGPAEFSVALDAGLRLGIEAGRASFSLPVPAAGSVRLNLVIPGDHTNVHISPGLITNRNSINGQTTVEAALVPGQNASIWWATREIASPAAPREVRFLSDVKTLATVSESDLRIAFLADVTVVQGDPAEFKLVVPPDYTITDVSGATVEGSEIDHDELTVKMNSSTPRAHQFLISMEKGIDGATRVDVPFIGFKNTQRETGEVLVEGAGAMELTAKEGGGLKRLDPKETNPNLRSLARFPLQAAFRYHRQPNETPALALEWTRFPDTAVLAAVAERAVVTTLVTSEGRSLTEVKLTVKNQAQPFLKVGLPQDASILSADVAGEKVKPVEAADGHRVPLLRDRFHPTGAYEVSFVFMHSGAPFAKKGGSELALPSMDIPINLLEWEVYLPEQYKVKDFGGDAIAVNLQQLDFSKLVHINSGAYHARTKSGTNAFDVGSGTAVNLRLVPGQLGGVVMDPSGATITGAQVKVTSIEKGATQTVTTDSEGNWIVSGMPSGHVRIEASRPGFKTTVYSKTPYNAARPSAYSLQLSVAAASDTVEVTATAAPGMPVDGNGVFHALGDHSQANLSLDGQPNSDQQLKIPSAQVPVDKEKDQFTEQYWQRRDQPQGASANVFNLQKKVAGVLPVRVDVPRAGSSYHFARALVLDEETKVTFAYKTK